MLFLLWVFSDWGSVLIPGSFHGEEIKVKGQGWLALMDKDDYFLGNTTQTSVESRLADIKVQFETFHDAIVDDQPQQRSGIKATTTPELANVILLKSKHLNSGTVTRAKVKDSGSYLGYQIELGPNKYELFRREHHKWDFGWFIGQGDTEQKLVDLRVGGLEGKTESPNTRLIWAGDLDRDGKMDLILDVSDHYNHLHQIRVYTSGEAKNGDLLGLAASFSAVGC